ncbi:MAG: hypothetical protein GX621_09645, partial [Pirellulaceae bacterium]|nr:hypothetical protein [Pirellulaceae bacterium]
VHDDGTLVVNNTADYVYAGYIRNRGSGDSTGVLYFNNTANYGRFGLHGETETVAGIVCSNGYGVIQNVQSGADVHDDGTLVVNNTADYVYAGYLRDKGSGDSTGVVSLVKQGVGALTLSGSHILYIGGTTVSEGTLVLQDTTDSTFLTKSIAVNKTPEVNTTLEFATTTDSITFNGAISGNGTVVKSGSRNLVFGGDNRSFTGEIHVNTGRLRDVSGPANFGNPSLIQVNDGGQIYAYNDGDEYDFPLSIAGNGHSESAGYLGALRLYNGSTWAGNITLADDARITAYDAMATITGNISDGNNGYQVTFCSGNGGYPASGIYLEPSSGNSWTGGTLIAGAIVQLKANDALPDGGALTLGDPNLGAGGLDLNGHDLTVSRLETGATSTSHSVFWDEVSNTSATPATLTVDNDDDCAYAGVLSGNLALEKDGSGTLTLAGRNYNSGNASVLDGTLDILVSYLGNISASGSGQAIVPEASWYTVSVDTSKQGEHAGQFSSLLSNDLDGPTYPVQVVGDWQTAVIDSVEGYLTRISPNPVVYTFGQFSGGLLGPTGQAYRVGTVAELNAAVKAMHNNQDVFDLDLSLPTATKVIALESLLGYASCDYDYDDVYWIVTADKIGMSLSAGPNVVYEGDEYILTLGPVTGTSETITGYTIHWGDGSQSQYTAAEMAALDRQVPHIYDNSICTTITVDVTIGGTVCTALSRKDVFLDVIATPYVEILHATIDISENLRLTAMGCFVDPRPETWTATVDYGDGSGPQSLVLNPDKSFALDHTYTQAKVYTVTVTVTDSEDDAGQAILPLNVYFNVPPVVATLALVHGDSSGGSLVASNPTLTGQVTNDGPVSYLRVEFDWNDDGVVDEVTQTDAQGRFTCKPRTLQPGSLHVRARAVEWNSQNASELVGDWTSLSFTLEDATGPQITSLRLLADTGESGTDLVTTDPRVTGRVVVDAGPVFGLTVEIDTNGDGIAEGTTLTDSTGRFAFNPQWLQTGVITIQVRASRPGDGGATVHGPWESFSFTFDETSLATISGLTLVSDWGDGLTTDPTISGYVATYSSQSRVMVQFDHNGDDRVDGSVMADSSGYFRYVPRGLPDGEVTIRARAAEWDAGTSRYLHGDWESITFTLQTSFAPSERGPMSTTGMNAYERAVRAGIDFADAAVGGSVANIGVFDSLRIGSFSPLTLKAGGLDVALDSTTVPTSLTYSDTDSFNQTTQTDNGQYAIADTVTTVYTLVVTGDSNSGTFDLDVTITLVMSYTETFSREIVTSGFPLADLGEQTDTIEWSVYQSGEYSWTYSAEGTYSTNGGIVTYTGAYSSTETGFHNTARESNYVIDAWDYGVIYMFASSSQRDYIENGYSEFTRFESGGFNSSGVNASYTWEEEGDACYEWVEEGEISQTPVYIGTASPYSMLYNDFGDGAFAYSYAESGTITPGETTGTYSYDEIGNDAYHYESDEEWSYEYDDGYSYGSSAFTRISAAVGSSEYAYVEDGSFDASGSWGTYSEEETGQFTDEWSGVGEETTEYFYGEGWQFGDFESGWYDFTEDYAYVGSYAYTESGIFATSGVGEEATTETSGDYTWDESGDELYIYVGEGGFGWCYEDDDVYADYVFQFDESQTYTYGFVYAEEGSFDPLGEYGDYGLTAAATDVWNYSDWSASTYEIDDGLWIGSAGSESEYTETVTWSSLLSDFGSFDADGEAGEYLYHEMETGAYQFSGSGTTEFAYADPEPPPEEPPQYVEIEPGFGYWIIYVPPSLSWQNGQDTSTYTSNGEGGWTYEIHSSTAYSPDETVGLYDVAESSWSESHDAGSGTSVWTVTSHNTVTTWDDQWSDSFDSRYDHYWNESGLVTEDGLVAAYEEFESYDEEYRYDGTYQYEWDWWDETDENVEINTRDYSDYFTESLTDTWGFTYRESGVFGPGGEFGVYAYSESDATDYEYEGAGASWSQYEAEAYANCVLSQSETWDYDGGFGYRFTANDAGSFDEEGSIGLYHSAESAWGGTNREGASQWSQGYDFGGGYTSSASGSSDDT